jgi:hypothetical protein
VRGYLPDARINFEKETGGGELSGNYLIDNTRLVSEFGVQYRLTESGCCRSSTTSARKKAFRNSPLIRRENAAGCDLRHPVAPLIPR